METLYTLILVVVGFSAVQSLFGVGLLVFGTPTLLLVGHSFAETIALLLPASVLISLMQVIHGRSRIGRLRGPILLYSVPFIAVGLAIVLSGALHLDIKLLVGVALLVSAAARYHERVHALFARWLERYSRLYLMFMGLVHGLSNMGGGFLTILAATLYDDKENTRANIAYGYLVFALSQIAVLLVIAPEHFTIRSGVLAAVALGTYLTIGSFIYVRASKAVYQQAISVFMAAYGLVLIGQALL